MARLTISNKIINYEYPKFKLGTIVKYTDPENGKVSLGVIADYMNGDYEIITLTNECIPTTDVVWIRNFDDIVAVDEDADLGYMLLNYYKFKVEPDAKRGRFSHE
ncbi:MAG TPA: hypothetical protein DDY68_01795 [Porphyromonadaceae bacterium]|nr:hypothetical protein [Porphyromonadaceae bacterium]